MKKIAVTVAVLALGLAACQTPAVKMPSVTRTPSRPKRPPKTSTLRLSTRATPPRTLSTLPATQIENAGEAVENAAEAVGNAAENAAD